jgi:L-ascorbate metabolism protein UlaG (beta-lactamase superfamily)
MRVTYYGQSAFMVELQGATLLFDPFISGNPKAPKVDIATLKPDYILISHGHGDHVGDSETIAKQSGATIISNYEIVSWFETKNIKGGIGLNLGGGIDLPFGRVQLVPAWHSSTMPDGANGGTAGGFIVNHKDGTFYFSGDTALFQEMKLFGRRHTIDVAFLCLGDHYTMDMVDAVHAAEFLGTGTVVGMHFDTFPPIAIDHAKAHDLFKAAKKKLILPEPGKTFDI